MKNLFHTLMRTLRCFVLVCLCSGNTLWAKSTTDGAHDFETRTISIDIPMPEQAPRDICSGFEDDDDFDALTKELEELDAELDKIPELSVKDKVRAAYLFCNMKAGEMGTSVPQLVGGVFGTAAFILLCTYIVRKKS